jgi:hypothetical protein
MLRSVPLRRTPHTSVIDYPIVSSFSPPVFQLYHLVFQCVCCCLLFLALALALALGLGLPFSLLVQLLCVHTRTTFQFQLVNQTNNQSINDYEVVVVGQGNTAECNQSKDEDSIISLGFSLSTLGVILCSAPRGSGTRTANPLPTTVPGIQTYKIIKCIPIH